MILQYYVCFTNAYVFEKMYGTYLSDRQLVLRKEGPYPELMTDLCRYNLIVNQGLTIL